MLISCRNIKKGFADKVVLADVNLDIKAGDRVGLVGRNGSGKTTLANILTGKLDYEEGNIITSRKKLNIGYLQQTEALPNLSFSTLSNQTIMGEFQRIASHLGIQQISAWSDKRLQNLSGGEKTKLALAKVWALQPEVVILDEPTNHLDYEGIKYLINEIRNYPGTVLIISHDRYFLDQTVSQIAELEKGKIQIYLGNYSHYVDTKRLEQAHKQDLYESQQKEQARIATAIKQLKNWSDKAHRESRQKGAGMMGGKEYFRKKAKKRDQAVKSQIKRLEKMSEVAIKRPESQMQVNYNLQARAKGGKRLLVAEAIGKSYGGVPLFSNSSFYVNRGEKIGVLGPNGCGKTTLVKTILGKETLDTGDIFVSPSAKIAYVSQDLPHEEKDSLQDVVANWKLEEQKKLYDLLIQLGISFDSLSINMEELSRGERTKIDIGLAIMGEYDLLILDEPTNHLDLISREALEESLAIFPGTIIIISHDRYLLNRVCSKMLVFENSKISRIEDKVEGYFAKKDGPKDKEEEILLIETQISRVLSELSVLQANRPEYVILDEEYKQLIKKRSELKG